MAVVIAALLPVFLLIVLGFVLKRTPDAAGDAMARAGAADLLRAVPDAADPDAGQGRSQQGAGRRRRRRAAAVGARDVAAVPRAAAPARARSTSTAPPSPRSSRARPAGRPMSRSRSPAICSAISGWRWPRSRWSRSSRWSTCSASPCSRITPRRKSNRPRAIVMTVVRNPLIWACAIGLAHQRHPHCRCRRSGTRSRTRSAAPRSPSACW